MKHAHGCPDAAILRQSWAWLDAQVTVIRARQREERAWALHCALATAAAGTAAGQEYVQQLWETLQGRAGADAAAEADAVEQAQAQARLDGLVRQVQVNRDA